MNYQSTILALSAVALATMPALAQEPTCRMCPGSYVASEEIQAYLDRVKTQAVSDQEIRTVDVGRVAVGIGVVSRTKVTAPADHSVAAHDQVTEIYHVIDGTGTLVLGPDLLDARRRESNRLEVQSLNGPGVDAQSIRNGATFHLKAGDVVVIPAGTGHQWTRIDDHIHYLMIRVDPDKIVPLKDESASKADLAAAPRQ